MFERGAARSTRSDTRVRRVCQCRGLRKGFMGLHEPASFDFCKSRCGSDDPATGTYSARARVGATTGGTTCPTCFFPRRRVMHLEVEYLFPPQVFHRGSAQFCVLFTRI